MSPDSRAPAPTQIGTGQVLKAASDSIVPRAAEARRRHHHRRHVHALDRALDCCPYPDIEATYPRVELRESRAYFDTLLREHAESAS